MHHIIYLSWATVPLTDRQLRELLLSARRRNAELDVTGVLLYGNECFMQLLEGEKEIVQELYAHIRRDARHHNIITFADKAVGRRAFAEWAMAFQPVSSQQFDKIVGYLGSPQVPLHTVGLSGQDQRVFDTLRAFVLP